MNLRGIMPSEQSQSQKAAHCMIPYIPELGGGWKVWHGKAIGMDGGGKEERVPGNSLVGMELLFPDYGDGYMNLYVC